MDRQIRVARAAGILEGEGSFFVQTGKHSPQVSCQMTDKDVLLELLDLFGGTLRSNTPQKEHHKPSWTWCVQGDLAKTTMEEIIPYMFSRRSSKIREVLLVWEERQTALERKRQNGLEAAKAYLNGEGSLRQIASKYGVSYQTVKNYLAS